jgi:hypothetical protein
MAPAVLAAPFLVFCLASGLSPIKEELRQMQASMSLDHALEQLDGRLPSNVAALVSRWRGEDAAHEAKKLNILAVGKSVGNSSGRKNLLDKKGVESARIKLNEMLEDTQEKLDKESVECEATIWNQKALMEETSADMKLYDSQNTKAGEDHLRATSTINNLDTTSTKLEDELTSSKAQCAESIEQLTGEIAIMVNDSIVLQRILGMIDCPEKTALVQCNDTQGNTTTFQKPELRAELDRIQSNKVKGLVDGAVLLSFKSGGMPVPTSRAAAFFQHEDKSTQTLKHRQRLLRGGQEPLVGDMNDGPGPDEEGCSLATNPNCGKLQDKFQEISGEVDSDIAVYSKHLSDRKDECELERENYEAQISDLQARLENWQTALAEAAQRGIQAGEGSRLKRGQYNEQGLMFVESKNECDLNIRNFKSEICALGKIRGEMYKMSAVPKFIEDCEVGAWTRGDCSKACMESPTDFWGNQTLAREVATPPSAEGGKILGAKCPPLKLMQSCNKVRCPIDCIQGEWSEWSSCSTKCGGGIRERIRSINRAERYNGEPCGPASKTETCNMQDCDKDCVLGPWSKIQNAKCTKACGGGVKVSTRPVIQEAIGMGSCSEPLEASRFRTTECNVAPCEPEGKTLMCDSQVDVIILLDGSGSLGPSGWAAVKSMGKSLVSAFGGASNQSQVAVQLFSGPGKLSTYKLCTGRGPVGEVPDIAKDCGISWETPLTADTGHFTADMKNAGRLIEELKWPSKSTFTSLALSQALAETLYGRDGVPKVVVVVTDGIPSNPSKTSEAAKALKDVARLIWVPVTAGAPKEQLKEWASTPTDQNIVTVADFKELVTPMTVTQVIAEVCPEAH